MNEDLDTYHGKSVGDLGQEAVWFLLHTLFAILVVCLILLGGVMLHADPDAASPKVAGTVLSFVLPMMAGFLVTKVRQDFVARFVWISGLLAFLIVCVWVNDLPTGNGVCEHCGAVDKLTRTFFSIQNGSGLASGQGLLLGCWLPLSLFGYALGARLAGERRSAVVLD